MIDCKNCGFFTNPSNHPIKLLLFYQVAWWPVGSGSVPWPLRSSPGWRIADNWGDRGLDWAARLETEAWGRHIKGGNLFHLRIRLSWPGLDTAHCQGLISGAGTKVAVQSASNKRRSVLFLFQNSYNQQFLYISISKLHININSLRLAEI